MKICIVGLGSIGQRHAWNINKVLSRHEMPFTIDALRVQGRKLDNRLEDLLSTVYHSYEELPGGYDVIFITNPTAFHYEAVSNLLQKTQHMFIEKPVFDGYRDIGSLKLRTDGIYYVACPLRHKKAVRHVKDLVGQGEHFYSVRAISSSYLPGWRKGADYRKSYSAKKELGGGVELDLIHEWDYLTYLFGLPEKMFKITGHLSGLATDTDDIAVYIAGYQDKTAELHLDYFGAETVRVLELFGDRRKYTVDLVHNTIHAVSLQDGEETWTDFGEDDCYLSEMEYFFRSVWQEEKSFNEIGRANTLVKFIMEGQC
ncbi:MAG: Gfo/Idh/MocA family oxidoreductase [Lachnospiraceae bacterium]|nr:Gfo/Idh/MocA family oxidoreductase [Lachnospiraceae bacterium]